MQKTQRTITLDENVLESVEYIKFDTWRELKRDSVLVTDRMYMKVIFAKKAEVNVQGKVFLWKTIPLKIPKETKLKDLKETSVEDLEKRFLAKTPESATHKYSSYIALTEKKKILSFGLILRKDQNLQSLCSEYKRKETDPNYAMRMKNYLMYMLIAFVFILLMKDSQIVEMDIIEMKWWWVYALCFGFIWGLHRESIEAKCWYLASLRLTHYREPIDLEKKDLPTRVAQFIPKWDRPRVIHLDIETHIVIPWYSAEISPQAILDLTMEDLQKDVYQVAMSVTSAALAEKANYEKRYEVAKDENAVLRSEIARMKEQQRLGIEIGKSLSADHFEITLIDEASAGQRKGSGRTMLTNIDITKIFIIFILIAGGLVFAFLAMNFFVVVDLDLGSKLLIAAALLVGALFVFLLIYKGRS